MILLSSSVLATQLIALSRAGTSEILEQGEKAAFLINNEKYYVTVEKIYSRTVDMKIASQEITLGFNEIKKIDVDNDYIYDVSVKLTGVSEDNAKLLFSSVIEVYSKIKQEPIIEIIEQEEIETIEEIQEDETETFKITILESERLTELFETYFKYITAGIIILIILIAIISMTSKLKKSKKPLKKAGRYISDLFFEEIKPKKK